MHKLNALIKSLFLCLFLIFSIVWSPLQSQEIDESFAPSIQQASAGYAIDLQPDDKILVVTSRDVIVQGQRANYLVRFLPDGSLDSSFTFPENILGRPAAMKCQSDGRIIVAGNFKDKDGKFIGNLIRLLPDGQIDSSFNTYSAIFPNIVKLEVLPNNKILLLGYEQGQIGRDFFVSLVGKKGIEDTAFNTLIFRWEEIENRVKVSDIGYQSENDIILAGTKLNIGGYTQDIFRIDSSGTVDTTFNPSILSDSRHGFVVKQIAILANGRIGVLSEDEKNISLLDESGILVDSYEYENNYASIFPLNQKDFVVLGRDIHLFSSLGDFKDRVQFNYYDGTVLGSINTSDTTLVIVGSFTALHSLSQTHLSPGIAEFFYKRTVNNFSSKISFKHYNKLGIFKNGTVNSFITQPDGKIVVGGYFHIVDGISRNHIARLLPNGSIDTTFNPELVSFNSIIENIQQQSNGNLVIGGQDKGEANNFNDNTALRGVAITDKDGYGLSNLEVPPPKLTAVPFMEVDQNDRIYLGNKNLVRNGLDSFQQLWRFSIDGILEEKYDKKYITSSEFIWGYRAISDNNLLLWGYQLSYENYDTTFVVKILPSGERDTTFNPPLTTDFVANSAFELDSGRIGVIGNMSNSTTPKSIWLLDSTGQIIYKKELGINAESDPFIILPTILPYAKEYIYLWGNIDRYDEKELSHNSLIIDKFGNYASELFPDALTSRVNDVQFIEENTLMLGGQFSLESILSPLLKVTLSSTPTSVPTPFEDNALMTLFPNPLSDSRLTLSLNQSLLNKSLHLKIFELSTGRIVHQEDLIAQENHYIWLKNLGQGIYACKLESEHNSFTKLLLIK